MHIQVDVFTYRDIYTHIHDAASQVPPAPPNGYGYTGAMFPAPPPVGGLGGLVVAVVVVVVVVLVVSRSE